MDASNPFVKLDSASPWMFWCRIHQKSHLRSCPFKVWWILTTQLLKHTCKIYARSKPLTHSSSTLPGETTVNNRVTPQCHIKEVTRTIHCWGCSSSWICSRSRGQSCSWCWRWSHGLSRWGSWGFRSWGSRTLSHWWRSWSSGYSWSWSYGWCGGWSQGFSGACIWGINLQCTPEKIVPLCSKLEQNWNIMLMKSGHHTITGWKLKWKGKFCDPRWILLSPSCSS